MLKKSSYLIIIMLIISCFILNKSYAVSNCKVILNCNESLDLSESGETKTITLKIEPNGNKILDFLINIHATNNVTIENVKVLDENKFKILDNTDKNNILIETNDNENYIAETEEVCQITIKINDITSINYAYIYVDFNDGYSGMINENYEKMQNIETNNITFKVQNSIQDEDWYEVEGESESEYSDMNNESNDIPTEDNTVSNKPIAKTGEYFSIFAVILILISMIIFVLYRKLKQ